MADIAPQTSTSDMTYRPLSALAVAGFLISCLFGGIVLVSAVIAITQGAPFFFPEWILLVAVAGFVLSYSGASDIRNAEGTKAGARLASWGMGLSLVCGLGYFAYAYSTRLALTQQANAFLTVLDDDSGFFPRLQKGGKDKTELYRAFLLTLPAFDRAGVRAEDEAGLLRLHDTPGPDGSPGKISQFLQHELVSRLAQAGDAAKIEPKGVKDWVYENRSYQLSRTYRIETPEAISEVLLAVKSSEGQSEGQGRTWFVDIRSSYPQDVTLTDLGTGLRKLRGHAVGQLYRLSQVLQRGPDKNAGDVPEVNLVKIDRTDWTRVHAEQATRDELKMRVYKVLEGGAGKDRWELKMPQDAGNLAWKRDGDGHITVQVPVQLMLGSVGVAASHLATDATFSLRTRTPVDLEALAAVDDQQAMPAFDIVAVRFARAYPFMRPGS